MRYLQILAKGATHENVLSRDQPMKSNISHRSHCSNERMIHTFKKRFWICLLLTIPLLESILDSSYKFQERIAFPGKIYFLFSIATTIFLYGGIVFLRGSFNELRNRSPGMMTLVTLGISIGYIYSTATIFGLQGKLLFLELATLIDIMLLGHWIEMHAISTAGKSLRALTKLLPTKVHKLSKDGTISDIALKDLQKNDTVLVKPGEKIPADGIIIKGISTINESMLTGESIPVAKQKNNPVIGGSVNGEGTLTIKVEKTGSESFISEMIKLIYSAQQSKSHTQTIADKAAVYLTIIAMISGIVTFCIWTIFFHESISFALERTVSVMLITCPHALGLAIPLVVTVSTSLAAKHGLFIRNRTAFEQARKLNIIVFDKTGSLTTGNFSITNTMLISKKYRTDEILSYASALASQSSHPIAKAISESVASSKKIETAVSIPGKGIKGNVDGKEIALVGYSYLKENQYDFDNQKIAHLEQEGKTVVYLLINHTLIAAVALADTLRESSKETIETFKKMGITCIMITGDRSLTANWVGNKLGIDTVMAQLLPQEKVEKIKQLKRKDTTVAMVGDGINDAPALTEADIGIAIGTGTDLTIETADIILMRSDPLDIISIYRLAKSTCNKMMQNIAWATGYNIIAIPIAAGMLYKYGIVLSPQWAAIIMSCSTIICAINAQTLSMPAHRHHP